RAASPANPSCGSERPARTAHVRRQPRRWSCHVCRSVAGSSRPCPPRSCPPCSSGWTRNTWPFRGIPCRATSTRRCASRGRATPQCWRLTCCPCLSGCSPPAQTERARHKAEPAPSISSLPKRTPRTGWSAPAFGNSDTVSGQKMAKRSARDFKGAGKEPGGDQKSPLVVTCRDGGRAAAGGGARTYPSERQLHSRRHRQAGGKFPRLFLHHLLDLGLGVIVGSQDQIFQYLDIIFLEQRRVDPQHLHLELARQSDADQPTTGLAGCLQCGNFIL